MTTISVTPAELRSLLQRAHDEGERLGFDKGFYAGIGHATAEEHIGPDAPASELFDAASRVAAIAASLA